MLKRSVFFAAALLAASSWTAPAVSAAPGVTQFDGNWSVSIVTDSGECDRGYRYALHIAGGKIYYDNPSFNISGQVNPGGQVQRRGQGRLSGSGRHRADVARLRHRHLERPVTDLALLRTLGSGAPGRRRQLSGSSAYCARAIAAQHFPRQRPGVGRVLDHQRAVDDDGGARA